MSLPRFGGAIALVLFKLWAIAHLPIHASLAYHDNLRYIIRATQLLQGDVPYDGLVLARQPGYPLFILASYHLGIPPALLPRTLLSRCRGLPRL